ncbi:cora family metal ion transporter [Boeremia exigua]|uniref:cora family metal ion transporter n=1 Tax=Boeremia exigua TaxID=749465 RepID=UPI001E8E0D04|nr:cora family metal ion transporter [Boeremia exigua]KAH6638853.1 cora family metal ion transporter [Boeremia exigua]
MPSVDRPADLRGLDQESSFAANNELLQKGSLQEKSEKFPMASSTVPVKERPGRLSLLSWTAGATTEVSEIEDLVSPKRQSYRIFDACKTKDTWWLDVLNPTEADMNALAKEFSIHPLTSEDIRTGETREKLEVFKNYYFVSFRSFDRLKFSAKHHVKPVNAYLVVFPTGLISFTFHPSPHTANVQSRIRKLETHVVLSSDWICYALIDDIVDAFGPMIDQLERETIAIEDGAFFTRPHELGSELSKTHLCRKKIMDATHLLRGKPSVVRSLARCCGAAHAAVPHGVAIFFSDVQDHVATMASKLEHCEGILSRSRADYLARLSVDRIATGNRTLKFIIRITVIAAIVVPLNVICGLFGMNVRVPGGDDDRLFWWGGILGTIILFILASVTLARRLKVI